LAVSIRRGVANEHLSERHKGVVVAFKVNGDNDWHLFAGPRVLAIEQIEPPGFTCVLQSSEICFGTSVFARRGSTSFAKDGAPGQACSCRAAYMEIEGQALATKNDEKRGDSDTKKKLKNLKDDQSRTSMREDLRRRKEAQSNSGIFIIFCP
jgi:hypothetical protein